MKDYTSNIYCDFLFINDLLSLKKGQDNQYEKVVKRSGKEVVVPISNVSIFGTVVEIKRIGERGILYSVDDGTGIITCKYNDKLCKEIMDTIHIEQQNVLNEIFLSGQTRNDSIMNYSTGEDDTIFNDHTLQEEEVKAIERNRLKAIYSIWYDIEASFLGMEEELNIGDTVLIEGKLYSYLNINQIHVNSMRFISIKEEMVLTQVKLENLSGTGKNDLIGMEFISNVQLTENTRRSGIMTFDHIHHLEINDLPKCTFLETKNGTHKNESNFRKRQSITKPELYGTITFDTLIDNSPGPSYKLAKISNET